MEEGSREQPQEAQGQNIGSGITPLSRSTRPSGLVLAIFTAVTIAILGGGYISLYGNHSKTQANADAQTCGRVVGPLKDRGTEVVQASGRAFVPYGITVSGISHSDYGNYLANDDAEISAAAAFWCSNVVRLQVAQDDLVGASGNVYSKPYMDAIKGEVASAENLGLTVVINAQTENVGKEPGPTHATVAFWKALSGVYGHDPGVIFDLFNEPRISPGSIASEWAMWQNGGKYQGKIYLGMQQIADDIRADGAQNLLWIEGPDTAQTLSLVWKYPIRNDGPISYAIHHPVGKHTPASWDQDFGYLVKDNIAPVVVGEWTNYASDKSECWSDAPTAVPEFLNYLQNLNIGMTAWTLEDGVLAESSNLADPTHIKPNWACKVDLNGVAQPNEGAGNQIMNWYKRKNELPATPSPTVSPTPSPTATPTPTPTPSLTPTPTLTISPTPTVTSTP